MPRCELTNKFCGFASWLLSNQPRLKQMSELNKMSRRDAVLAVKCMAYNRVTKFLRDERHEFVCAAVDALHGKKVVKADGNKTKEVDRFENIVISLNPDIAYFSYHLGSRMYININFKVELEFINNDPVWDYDERRYLPREIKDSVSHKIVASAHIGIIKDQILEGDRDPARVDIRPEMTPELINDLVNEYSAIKTRQMEIETLCSGLDITLR